VPEDFGLVDFDDDEPESLEDDDPESPEDEDDPESPDDEEPESPDDDEPESPEVFVSVDLPSPDPESLFLEPSSAAFSR